MANKARAKGTATESALVKHLTGEGFDAERLPLQGMFDKGDIRVRELPWIAWEVKSCRTPRYGEWLREANAEAAHSGTEIGVVVHKPHGTGLGSVGDWHVVMTFDTFLGLLQRVSGQAGGPS